MPVIGIVRAARSVTCQRKEFGSAKVEQRKRRAHVPFTEDTRMGIAAANVTESTWEITTCHFTSLPSSSSSLRPSLVFFSQFSQQNGWKLESLGTYSSREDTCALCPFSLLPSFSILVPSSLFLLPSFFFLLPFFYGIIDQLCRPVQWYRYYHLNCIDSSPLPRIPDV